MRTAIFALISVLLFIISCRKSSDNENFLFYGQDLVVVKQRLGGEWKNHYARNATGQIVTFPDCFLNFKFNSADSLIITCNAQVTSRALMTWGQEVLPQSDGKKAYFFEAAPVNSGNIWILAPETIEADTLVLLAISEVDKKYYLTRK